LDERPWLWDRSERHVVLPGLQQGGAEIAYKSSAYPRSDGADWQS
jgi:hypothetical protein